MLRSLIFCLTLLSSIPATCFNVYAATPVKLETLMQKVARDPSVVREVDDQGRTMLFKSVEQGDEHICRFLLQQGADPNAEDIYGLTPLCFAGSTDRHFCEGPSKSERDAREKTRERILNMLLESGADINHAGQQNVTPMHMVAMEGNLPILRRLITKGAHLNDTTQTGHTPLHLIIARWRGSDETTLLEAVRLMVSHGADVNARSRCGETPLELARQKNKRRVMRYMESQGAVLGSETLQQAIALNDSFKVDELISSGADVLAADAEAKTPLMVAVESGNIELIRKLLEHGAKQELESPLGSSYICHAAGGNKPELLKFLLLNGAPVRALCDHGDTPLHRAAWGGYEHVARILLDHGADVNATNDWGDTPLHSAAFCKNPDIAALLIQSGARINAVSKHSETPLDLATKVNHPVMMRLLRSHGGVCFAEITTYGSHKSEPVPGKSHQ